MNLLNSFKALIIDNIPSGGKTFENETLTANNVFDDYQPDREYKNVPTVEFSETELEYNHFLNGNDILTNVSIYVRTISRESAIDFAVWINELVDAWLRTQRENKAIEDYLLDSSKVSATERGLEIGSDHCNVATFTIYY